MTQGKDVRTYLEELEKTKEVFFFNDRECMEIYISLWGRAMVRWVVAGTDGVDDALVKIESEGGLYMAAGEEGPT